MENIDKEEIDELSGDECFTTLDKSQYIIFYFTILGVDHVKEFILIY